LIVALPAIVPVLPIHSLLLAEYSALLLHSSIGGTVKACVTNGSGFIIWKFSWQLSRTEIGSALIYYSFSPQFLSFASISDSNRIWHLSSANLFYTIRFIFILQINSDMWYGWIVTIDRYLYCKLYLRRGLRSSMYLRFCCEVVTDPPVACGIFLYWFSHFIFYML